MLLDPNGKPLVTDEAVDALQARLKVILGLLDEVWEAEKITREECAVALANVYAQLIQSCPPGQGDAFAASVIHNLVPMFTAVCKNKREEDELRMTLARAEKGLADQFLSGDQPANDPPLQ